MDKDQFVYDWDGQSMKETTRKRLIPATYEEVEELLVLGQIITRKEKTQNAYYEYPHIRHERVRINSLGAYPFRSPFRAVRLEVQKGESSKVRTCRFMTDYLAKHALPQRYWPKAIHCKENNKIYSVASVKAFCECKGLEPKYIRELLNGKKTMYRDYSLVENPAFSRTLRAFRRRFVSISIEMDVL